MINTIYIEQTVRDHERTNKILKRFSDARIISCDRYGEVFNPRSQNFRIQKQNPALIIAEKFKNFLLPTPEGFGLGIHVGIIVKNTLKDLIIEHIPTHSIFFSTFTREE